MSKKSFSADVEQLIELVTHSVYSDKEIFLRELLSNANDAIQKAKFLSVSDPNYLWNDFDFKILLDVDKEHGVLKITDNGVGMTQSELEKNIWTIAKSWTKDFLNKIKKSDNYVWNQMIWQFGIGFYSVFMVADKVELETKSSNSKKAFLWTSNWKWNYEITDSNKTTRWTEIRIFLNNESKDFLNFDSVKSLVKKHSNYLPVPILLKKENSQDYEQINTQKSLRTKNKSEVSSEEYKEFYNSLTFDNQDPLDVIHLNVEWVISYRALLFIPKQKNIFESMMNPENKQYWPSLFVKNVLILENCSDLLPVWLRFVKWVVETQDLPLNISREVLQKNSVIQKIQSSLVKEILKSLVFISKNNFDSYRVFFENYGSYIKEWVHYDFARKEEVASLLLYFSAKTKDYISFEKYIENYSNEKKIYFVLWKSILELQSMPKVIHFLNSEKDVFLMANPLDEWVISAIKTFRNFDLVSIMSESNLSKEQSLEEKNNTESRYKDFLSFAINEIWETKIENIKIVNEHESVLSYFLHKDWEPTFQMQKIMKSMWQELPQIKKTLVLNSDNVLVKKVLDTYWDENQKDFFKNFVKYAYYQAILLDWWDLDNIHDFFDATNWLILIFKN